VGATEASEHGPPCRCFLNRAPAEPTREEVESAASGSAAPAEKICVLCGKNVAGHRRLKDSRGYICLDCAKKEEAARKPQGVKCPKCGRVVKEDSIGMHDGQRMCQRCLRAAREVAKPGSKRFRKIDDTHFKQSHKTQLLIMVGIAIVLGLIILLNRLGFI